MQLPAIAKQCILTTFHPFPNPQVFVQIKKARKIRKKNVGKTIFEARVAKNKELREKIGCFFPYFECQWWCWLKYHFHIFADIAFEST